MLSMIPNMLKKQYHLRWMMRYPVHSRHLRIDTIIPANVHFIAGISDALGQKDFHLLLTYEIYTLVLNQFQLTAKHEKE